MAVLGQKRRLAQKKSKKKFFRLTHQTSNVYKEFEHQGFID
jgi:hypothetical protein